MEHAYLKSLHRCPVCGGIVGCVEDGTNLLCSLEAFRNHVAICREADRKNPGRIRYLDSEDG